MKEKVELDHFHFLLSLFTFYFHFHFHFIHPCPYKRSSSGSRRDPSSCSPFSWCCSGHAGAIASRSTSSSSSGRLPPSSSSSAPFASRTLKSRGSVRWASASCWRIRTCSCAWCRTSALCRESSGAWPRRDLRCRCLPPGWRSGRCARPALVVFAFLYFIWLLGYAAWAFRQGARAAGGVTHWRMQHAALGALLLAVVFILAVLMAVWPCLARGRGVAGSAGRAWRRAELLLRVRAAGMASAHVAVLRALRVAVRSSCRGRRGVTERRAEPAVHVRGFGGGRDRWRLRHYGTTAGRR